MITDIYLLIVNISRKVVSKDWKVHKLPVMCLIRFNNKCIYFSEEKRLINDVVLNGCFKCVLVDFLKMCSKYFVFNIFYSRMVLK